MAMSAAAAETVLLSVAELEILYMCEVPVSAFTITSIQPLASLFVTSPPAELVQQPPAVDADNQQVEVDVDAAAAVQGILNGQENSKPEDEQRRALTMTSVLLTTDVSDTSSCTCGVICSPTTGDCISIPVRCVFTAGGAVTWRRGAYMAGWLDKWPMKSQSLGRKTNRYFILRDQLVTYHKSEEEATGSNGSSSLIEDPQAMRKDGQDHSVSLCGSTVLRVGTHHRSPCVSLKSPRDMLWFKAENSDVDAAWMAEIQFSVNQLWKQNSLRNCLNGDFGPFLNDYGSATSSIASSATTSSSGSPPTYKPTCKLSASSPMGGASDIPITEYVWFNDPPGYNLACVDAVAASAATTDTDILAVGIFGKAGEYYAEYTVPSGRLPKCKVPEVPRGVTIHLVKIYRHFVIFCGNRGWLGILNTVTNQMLVPIRACHFTESKILSVSIIPFYPVGNTAEAQIIMATGDRLGGLALWKCDLHSFMELNLLTFVDMKRAILSLYLFYPAVVKGSCRCDLNLNAMGGNLHWVFPQVVIGTDSNCSLHLLQSAPILPSKSAINSRIVQAGAEFDVSVQRICMLDICDDQLSQTAFYSVRKVCCYDNAINSGERAKTNVDSVVKISAGRPTVEFVIDKVATITNDLTPLSLYQCLRIKI
jgi:hypothetical protein